MRFFGGFILATFLLSACNPLGGDLPGSEVEDGFHPGYVSRTLSLNDLASLFRGGESVRLVFELPSEIASAKLEFTEDGEHYSLVSSLDPFATSYDWTVPSVDTVLGQMRLTAVRQDGIESSRESSVFAIDATSPGAPSVTLTSSSVTHDRNGALSVASCSDRSQIAVSENTVPPALNSTLWQTCDTASGAILFLLPDADRTHTLYVYAKDAAGNRSPASTLSVLLDRTPPALALTSFAGGELISGQDDQTVHWTASDSGSGLQPNSAVIELSSDSGANFTAVASAQNVGGSYAWSPGILNGTQYRVRVSVSDQAGNTAIVASASDFTIDSTAPAITSGSLKLNGQAGNPIVTNNTVAVSLDAEDATTNITHFCLKYGSTLQPDASDDCWHAVNEPGIDLTPAKTLNLAAYPFTLGFASGVYTVSAWVRDEAQNISSVSTASATYLKPDAVSLTSILSVSTESPNLPIDVDNTNLSASAPLYIKWKSNVPSGNSIQSIRIEYLTSEVDEDWTDTGATGLVDGSNGCTPDGGGTADDGFTGCYLWHAPTSGYFKIRILVEDQFGSTRIATAQPNNTSPFEILAGNLDMSLDGDPRGVILQYGTSDQYGEIDSLAVAKTGVIYFHDTGRGVLKFDPSTNSVSVLFAQNSALAAHSYSDQPRTNVVFKNPAYLDLDANDRLYVFDQKYIDRYDPVTDRVTTIIGGGTQTATTVAGGRNLSITAQAPSISMWHSNVFSVMPNGDLFFRSDYSGTAYTFPQNWSVRYYKTSEDKVYTVKADASVGASSSDAAFDPSQCYLTNFAYTYDVSTLAFTHFEYRPFRYSTTLPDCQLGSYGATTISLTVPASIVNAAGVTLANANVDPSNEPPTLNWQGHIYRSFTGKDGKIYLVNANNSTLYRYDPASNTDTKIYGSGTKGVCDDGTLATQCDSKLSDAYVTREGRVYVVDRGQIRMIDENGNVQTIFGQSPLYNSDTALTARFSAIGNLRFNPSSNELVFSDTGNLRLKRMTLGGSVSDVVNLNGVGPLAINSDPRSCTFDFYPGTRDLIYSGIGGGTQTQVLHRQNASTGVWSILTGSASGVAVVDADGKIGSAIDFSDDVYAHNGIIRFINDHLLIDFTGSTGPSFYNHVIKAYDLLDSFRQSHVIGIVGPTSGNPTCSGENVDPATCALGTISNRYAPEAGYDSGTGDYLIPDVTTNKILRIGALKSTWLDLGQAFRGIAIDYAGNRVYYCASDGSNWRVYVYDTSAETTTKASGWPLDYDCVGNSMVIDDTGTDRRLIFPVSLKGSGAVQAVGALGNLP